MLFHMIYWVSKLVNYPVVGGKTRNKKNNKKKKKGCENRKTFLMVVDLVVDIKLKFKTMSVSGFHK